MILIATPTRDVVSAGFTADLVKLCRRHPDARWAALTGIYVANLRNQAVRMAQAAGASHLLFLDSDMRFPEDTLDRLLSHRAPIVAANYPMRTFSEWWVARKNGQSLSSVGRTGLEAVDSVGCGVMLLSLDRLTRLDSPWFSTPLELTGEHVGEDVFFCRKAALNHTRVCVDHALSQDVRHQGTVEFGVSSFDLESIA